MAISGIGDTHFAPWTAGPDAPHGTPRVEGPAPALLPPGGVATARLHGFDLQDAPVLAALAQRPGELVQARTAVPLRHAMAGATVLVLFEDGDAQRPIVVGVIQEALAQLPDAAPVSTPLSCDLDGQRLTLSAEREIVLRCGEASITLTRGGKVVIQGSYVLSRSTGYNKIKGAAVDIN